MIYFHCDKVSIFIFTKKKKETIVDNFYFYFFLSQTLDNFRRSNDWSVYDLCFVHPIISLSLSLTNAERDSVGESKLVVVVVVSLSSS